MKKTTLPYTHNKKTLALVNVKELKSNNLVRIGTTHCHVREQRHYFVYVSRIERHHLRSKRNGKGVKSGIFSGNIEVLAYPLPKFNTKPMFDHLENIFSVFGINRHKEVVVGKNRTFDHLQGRLDLLSVVGRAPHKYPDPKYYSTRAARDTTDWFNYILDTTREDAIDPVRVQIGGFSSAIQDKYKDNWAKMIQRITSNIREDDPYSSKKIVVDLSLIDTTLPITKQGHANVLVIDKENKIVSRFDPHGLAAQKILAYSSTERVSHDAVDKTIKKMMKTNKEFSGYKYEKPSMLSSLKQGLQHAVRFDKAEEGRCVVWTHYFMHLLVKNDKYTAKEVANVLESYPDLTDRFDAYTSWFMKRDFADRQSLAFKSQIRKYYIPSIDQRE